MVTNLSTLQKLQGKKGRQASGTTLLGLSKIIIKLCVPVVSWDYRVIRTRYVQKYFRFFKNFSDAYEDYTLFPQFYHLSILVFI